VGIGTQLGLFMALVQVTFLMVIPLSLTMDTSSLLGTPIILKQNNSWMIIGVHTPSADIVDGSNCVYGSYAVFARVSDSLDFMLTAMSAL
jgi:hypothetical protein